MMNDNEINNQESLGMAMKSFYFPYLKMKPFKNKRVVSIKRKGVKVHYVVRQYSISL